MTMLPSMVAFRGDLSVFNVLDIVQLIHSSQKTGRLRIFTSNRTQAGEVDFNQGRVVAASAEGQSDEEALQQLMKIQGGSFAFHPSPQLFPVRIQLSTANLLMQCLRAFDESLNPFLSNPA